MFDLGFFELLVIAVVALVVLGPERLPKAARMGGLWVRKARAQWYSVKSEFERELAADELKRSLVDPAAQLRDDIARAGRDVRGAVGDADRALRDVVTPTDAARDAADATTVAGTPGTDTMPAEARATGTMDPTLDEAAPAVPGTSLADLPATTEPGPAQAGLDFGAGRADPPR